MHDIKWIRQNPEAFDAGLKRRGLDARSPEILKLDEKKRGAQTELQELQKKRNEVAAKIGQAKAKGEDAAPIMAEAGKLKETIAAMEAGLTYGELEAVLEAIPNLPAEDVPQGTDETGNKLVREWGKKPELVFKPKEHFDLGEKLGLMSFDDAAKISGARFVVLKGALAKMERALAALFLDMNTAVGYTEVSPPFLANSNTMYGTGQLPKFGEDLFEILTEFKKLEHKYELQKASFNVRSEFQDRASIILEKFSQAMAHAKELGSNVAWSGPIFGLLSEFFNKNKIDFGADVENFRASAKKFEELSKQGIGRFFLIPTAEVPLTNLVGDSILEEEKLPMRMTAYTPCFRSEVGSAGKDTRGMIRQHQFSKVEMVSITTPEQSKAEHERMTGQAEAILQKLGLAYRVMLLCTGDMGFSSEKTYDIEVWLPGQNMYREISSCSNCGAFQARRMKARYKAKGAKETQFVHTLNGSGLPIGRTMVAILENYQNADGSITVPEALRPYMGMDVIK